MQTTQANHSDKQNQRKKIFSALFIATVMVLISFVYRNFFNAPKPVSKNGFYFNTIISIQLNDSSDETLIDDCFALADTYEHYFSRTLEGSDIYNINHANGKSVKVHPETAKLLQIGKEYSAWSDGAFDITIGALVELWDITNNDGFIPDETAIQAALDTVDYRNIQIEGTTVTLKNPNTRIDLGGIAKGYAADAMKAYLNENGVHEGFINLGGNVLTLGEKSEQEPYHIGIRKPFSTDGEIITSVDVSDQSVVTSGRYERYFEIDGMIYHHILNPKTGYPYENDLNGVTILSTSSVTGDALSTICFAYGLEKGMEFISSIPSTDISQLPTGICDSSNNTSEVPVINAIFVDRENQLHDSRDTDLQ